MATSIPPAVRLALLDRLYAELFQRPANEPPPKPPDPEQKKAAGGEPAAKEGGR